MEKVTEKTDVLCACNVSPDFKWDENAFCKKCEKSFPVDALRETPTGIACPFCGTGQHLEPLNYRGGMYAQGVRYACL